VVGVAGGQMKMRMQMQMILSFGMIFINVNKAVGA
jgi:hypothetical protein